MAKRPSLGDLRRRHDEALRDIDHLLADEKRKSKGIARAERHLRELRDDIEKAERDGDREAVRELEQHKIATVRKIEARRDDRTEIRTKITRRERTVAITEARIERRERKRLDEITCLDGAAMPVGWRVVLLDWREHGWGGRVNSADRTAKNCDRCSDKMSQAELWAAAQNGTGAPANPPASFCPTCGGTHEYVNDGTAYPGEAKGKRGPWWWLGIDLTLGDQAVQVAQRRGYRVRRPYMPREPWHVNFVGDPTHALLKNDRIMPRPA